MISSNAAFHWRVLMFLALACGAIALVSSSLPADLGRPAPPYFRITVVDAQTGRGIPCAMLKLMNATEYWTDNAGVVAFYEPDLMDQPVYFEVASHGYASPKMDYFGFPGVVLETKPGGSAVVKLHRENVAQRLYRLTGSGLYRDSLLLGDAVPPVQEVGKAPLAGQDGGDAAVYKGEIYWFWGDSAIPRFPLGVFKSTCAVSGLPGHGGLDPEVGVAYCYLRREGGDPRPIINLPGDVYWYAIPRVLRDRTGREHLVTDYAQIEGAGSMKGIDRGLVEFNEKTGLLELVAHYPKESVVPFDRIGPVFQHRDAGKDYCYYPAPYPAIRCPADFESQTDPAVREAFTCLKEGSRFDGTAAQLDRDAHVNLRWGWKRNTSPVTEQEMDQLIKAKAMTEQERWYTAMDAATGKRVLSQWGSIYWNPYRQRWVCLRLEVWGETLVGEVWYLEGDTPQGPWVYAQKIVTHAWKDHSASFYVPAQLPMFDKQGGRIIYFKGSFSAEFGDAKTPAPRHNYNTFMYKLELDDPRLFLPVPVYRVGGQTPTYHTKNDIPEANRDRTRLFFAPDRPRTDTIPVYEYIDPKAKTAVLTTHKPAHQKATLAFYAISPAASGLSKELMSITRPLNEFIHEQTGARLYTTEDSLAAPGYQKTGAPICRVWADPIRFNPYDL